MQLRQRPTRVCRRHLPPVTCQLTMQADHILLLDSFFYLVIFHGTTVASWRKNEYHLQPEHAAFAELLAVRICMSCVLCPNGAGSPTTLLAH